MAAAAGGATRAELLIEASKTGLKLFPNNTQIGGWAFSVDKGGNGQDWVEMAPIKRLDAPSGRGTHREALAEAVEDGLSDLGGGTGLYDTTLAAFKKVQDTYDPNYSNSVIVMTDGQNDDPNSITLDELLAELKRLEDPARPVLVLTIGMSDDADTKRSRRSPRPPAAPPTSRRTPPTSAPCSWTRSRRASRPPVADAPGTPDAETRTRRDPGRAGTRTPGPGRAGAAGGITGVQVIGDNGPMTRDTSIDPDLSGAAEVSGDAARAESARSGRAVLTRTGGVVAAMAAVGLVAGACSSDDSSSSATSATSHPAGHDASHDVHYKDGEYTAEGGYISPGGRRTWASPSPCRTTSSSRCRSTPARPRARR